MICLLHIWAHASTKTANTCEITQQHVHDAYANARITSCVLPPSEKVFGRRICFITHRKRSTDGGSHNRSVYCRIGISPLQRLNLYVLFSLRSMEVLHTTRQAIAERSLALTRHRKPCYTIIPYCRPRNRNSPLSDLKQFRHMAMSDIRFCILLSYLLDSLQQCCVYFRGRGHNSSIKIKPPPSAKVQAVPWICRKCLWSTRT